VTPAKLENARRAAVRAADPGLAPFAFARLDEEVATLLAPQRGASTVLAVYALLGSSSPPSAATGS
jgi:hypothetical protein